MEPALAAFEEEEEEPWERVGLHYGKKVKVKWATAAAAKCV